MPKGYTAIERFKDQDGHIYKLGDPWPVSGPPNLKRAKQLLGDNKYKRPFIRQVAEAQ
jgi:hypothetical protein